jgi:hypothetical protein
MTSSPEADALRSLAADMDPAQLRDLVIAIGPLVERLRDVEYDTGRLASWSRLLSDIAIASEDDRETSDTARNLADGLRAAVRMTRRNPAERMQHSILVRRVISTLDDHGGGLTFEDLAAEADVTPRALDGIMRPMLAHGVLRNERIADRDVYSKGPGSIPLETNIA